VSLSELQQIFICRLTISGKSELLAENLEMEEKCKKKKPPFEYEISQSAIWVKAA